LNTSGNPIRGLYASGDIVGLFFHNYPSCTGQTRNVVFSRLAGRHARGAGALGLRRSPPALNVKGSDGKTNFSLSLLLSLLW
jgi:hypothetical protein